MAKPYAGSLLEAAATLARLAANTALQYYRRPVDVETKDDGSPVTVADRDAERVAREWLALHFAGDGIVGEEFGLLNPDAPRRWILDPIDGTKAFVRGVPLWGTLVACTEGETVLAGAACFPVLDELVAAAPGEGCWYNGVRTHVSTVASLAEATILTTDDRFPTRPARGIAWRGLAADAGVVRTWGDCYGYLLVATGRAEVMVDDIVNPWDAAALQPIIEEAGGVFTDFRGARTAFGGDCIATNARLGAHVRERLLDAGEGA
jgi:histidinol phosphatase-like enzyme (inositol monophosphatase family)